MADIDVLFDEQIFGMHSRGGISRYFAELIREYGSHPEWGVRPLTAVRRSPNQHLRAVDPSVKDLPFKEMSIGWKVSKRLARYPSARAQRRLRPDVVHSTYYDPKFLHRFPGVPMVVTVHDMVPETMPSDLVDGDPHQAKREYVDHAAGIVCVSEATRQALFDTWGEITDRPVIVTGHSTSDQFSPTAPAADRGEDYFLHVGSRDHYKNFPLLMRAYAGSAAQRRGVTLLAVGGGALTAHETELAEELGIAEDLTQVTASEEELPGLYRGAVALVFPSKAEGFGMPVLEAMACGTPTVLADIPVFHEVAGDAAWYFPADDPVALRATLDRTTTDHAERDRMAAAGVARAAEYSWERTAEATAELYHLVAGKAAAESPAGRNPGSAGGPR